MVDLIHFCNRLPMRPGSQHLAIAASEVYQRMAHVRNAGDN